MFHKMLNTLNSISKEVSVKVALVSGIIGLILTVSTIIEKKRQVDISGEWIFSFHTLESTYKGYIDVVTEYKMHIVQQNYTVTGNGETWKHKDSVLNYIDHSPLNIQGVFKKDSIICTYLLKGKLRETTGSFKAGLSGNALNGYFSGTGADVKGIFKAEKIR